jgi:arylsulfatase A-like enzyme
MKRQLNQPERTTTRRTGVVSRFLLISAFLGLLIGLFEASLLWTTPRVIPLLVPDVGWGIWFLAPLVDMAFFGLVGLGLGLVASRVMHGELFVAVEGGIAITFLYLMVKWFHVEIGLHPFNPDAELLVPLIAFAAGFIASLILIALVWPRLAVLADHWLDRWLRPLARGLAACAVLAIMGIGVFVVRSSFSGTQAEAAPPPSGAPNIVFITLDTVRADHLSSYGYSRPTTPNIDRFARTGVLFENAIAATSWTLASHASMFTGLLPQQHGADFSVPLVSSPWTLAEILQSRGYETAGFIGNTYYLENGWGTGQGFGTYDDLSSSVLHSLAQTLLGNAVIQPLYQIFGRYDAFDRRNGEEVNADFCRWFHHNLHRPFFAFINYFDGHDPYIPPGLYKSPFGSVPMGLMRKVHWAEEDGSAANFSVPERVLLTVGYDNCLTYLDGRVGNLLSVLRQSREWQNTIVIISADHGEEFGGHGDYVHGFDLYRGLLHVPLIIAGPGVPRGVRISHVVGTRQLFSTVLDLAGRGNTPFSRTSLARFWAPNFRSAPSDDAVISELVPNGDLIGQRAMVSLTTPEWQYIAHRDGRQELYRWTGDHKEQNNLAAAPGEQATVEELRSRLIGLVSDAVGPWHGPEYLEALDSVAGPVRLSLLRPQPLQPDAPNSRFRIGMAQAFFKPDESMLIRPSRFERDLMRSLPYQ